MKETSTEKDFVKVVKQKDNQNQKDFVKNPITGALFYHYGKRKGLLNKPYLVSENYQSRTLKFVSIIQKNHLINKLYWLNKELSSRSLSPAEVCILLYSFSIIKEANVDVSALRSTTQHSAFDEISTKTVRFLYSRRGYNYLLSKETDITVITEIINLGVTTNKAYLKLKNCLPQNLCPFYSLGALAQAAIAFCVDTLSLNNFLKVYEKFISIEL